MFGFEYRQAFLFLAALSVVLSEVGHVMARLKEQRYSKPKDWLERQELGRALWFRLARDVFLYLAALMLILSQTFLP